MDLSPLSKLVPDFGSPTLQDFDTNIVPGQRLGGNSNRQFVRFYRKTFAEPYAVSATINPKTGTATNIKMGIREVTKEMVNIVTPGDKNTVDDVATDWHKREFFRQYKAFRDGTAAPLGMPIDECPYIGHEVATELKYRQVHTEEQLADSSDVLCDTMPDGFRLREFARARVKANIDSKASGAVQTLKVELDKSNKTIADMQEQIKQLLSGEKDPKTAELKRGPGRPPKEVVIIGE